MSDFFTVGSIETELPHGMWKGSSLVRNAVVQELPAAVRRDLNRQRQDAEKTKKPINPGFVITTILSHCVQSIGNEPVPPMQLNALTVGDRNHLLIHTQIAAGRSNIDTEIKCPSCGAMNGLSVDLPNLNTIRVAPTEDYSPVEVNGKTESHIELLHKERRIAYTLRLMTGDDQNDIGQLVQSNPVQANFILVAKVLRKIDILSENDEIEKSMEAPFSVEWVERNFTESLLGWLEKEYAENQPGPIFDHRIECYSCGHTWDVNVGDVDFLLNARP